jgi:peptide deformylase
LRGRNGHGLVIGSGRKNERREGQLARRDIRILGDPVLRGKATEVVDFDRSLRKLVRDLEDTMVEANGVGLAAPQIGVPLRVFTYLLRGEEVDEVAHLVNPEMVEVDPEEIEDDEGCLSVPGANYLLRRSKRVVARGFDLHGEERLVEGTERLARCLLHETDHLDGVIFLDRLDPEVRRAAMREFQERLLDGEDLVVKSSPHGPLG